MMKKLPICFAALLALVSLNATAGTTVKGFGETRADAVADAEKKARQLAKQKETCYEYVKEKDCKNNPEGGWTCEADVANHAGSCEEGNRKIKP